VGTNAPPVIERQPSLRPYAKIGFVIPAGGGPVHGPGSPRGQKPSRGFQP
jgi:hypothetical protein